MIQSLGVSTLAENGLMSDIFISNKEAKQISGITIAEGLNLKRGACLAQKKTTNTVDEVTVSAIVGTGNGTLTMDATAPTKVGVKAGIYKVVCTAAATGAGTFAVEDPDGVIIGTVTAGASGGTAGVFDGVLKFALINGSTTFATGAYFVVTVAMTAVDSKYHLWNTGLTDGREILRGVLGCDTDATDADEVAFMYVTGEFNKAALTAGHTILTGVYNEGSIVIKEEIE